MAYSCFGFQPWRSSPFVVMLRYAEKRWNMLKFPTANLVSPQLLYLNFTYSGGFPVTT